MLYDICAPFVIPGSTRNPVGPLDTGVRRYDELATSRVA